MKYILKTVSFFFLSLMYMEVVGEVRNFKESDTLFVLKNEKIQLSFFKGEDQVVLRQIVNHLSGKVIEVSNDDFLIGLKGQEHLSQSDFVFEDLIEETKDGTQKLTLKYKHYNRDLELIISYSLGQNAFFARRQLELYTKEETLDLREVTAWKLDFVDKCIYQEKDPPTYPHSVWGFDENEGFGLPVFFKSSFWGMEYPAAYNHYEKGTLSFVHYPGRTITNKFTAKPIVFGVSEENTVNERFQSYLNTILSSPADQHQLFTNYNTWTTLMPPTNKNSLELIEMFNEKMFKPFGASFDTYTIDDGWDDKNSLWEVRKDRFPEGFTDIRRELKSQDTDIGFWLSPSSGYDHGPWLAANGYPKNGTRDKYMCQSNPRYSTDLKKQILELVETNDIKFLKFDGNCMNCSSTDHPWHLLGNFARETNVDALIDLLTEIKKRQPDIFIDLTTGIWLSPWWLQHANVVWGEVYDGDPAAVVPTPNPGYGKFTTRDYMIHKRLRENPSFPISALEHLGIYTPDYSTTHDEIMSILGRGSRLLTFYLNPYDLLRQDKDWELLAKAINWGKANQAVLINTKLIEGDILGREVYGYSHFNKKKGILSLSNPFIEPKTFSFSLDRLIDESIKEEIDGLTYTVNIIYPYREVLYSNVKPGDSLEILLQGYETLMIELSLENNQTERLMNVRYQEISRSQNKIVYDLYGKQGATKNLSILSSDAKTIKHNNSIVDAGNQLKVKFSGEQESANVDETELVFKAYKGKGRIDASCRVHIPQGSTGEMHFLFAPITPSGYHPISKVRVDGKIIETRKNRAKLDLPHVRAFDEIPISDWSFISFSLSPGEHDIEIEIDSPFDTQGRFRAEVGSWLWLEHQLVKEQIEVEFNAAKDFVSIDPKPFASRLDKMREIISIHKNRILSHNDIQNNKSKKILNLERLTPIEVAMSKGALQFDKNFEGNPLSVAGNQYDHGFGMRSYGRIRFDIQELDYNEFQCFIGVDDTAGEGLVEFEVWIDDIKSYSSGLLKRGSVAKELKLNVTNAEHLELRVLAGPDKTDGDYANWCNPILLK